LRECQKPERNKPLGRPRSRWDDNLKIDVQEVGWGPSTALIWLRTIIGKLLAPKEGLCFVYLFIYFPSYESFLVGTRSHPIYYTVATGNKAYAG
jgi:hypothetical protein